jgi:hypothetical protein
MSSGKPPGVDGRVGPLTSGSLVPSVGDFWIRVRLPSEKASSLDLFGDNGELISDCKESSITPVLENCSDVEDETSLVPKFKAVFGWCAGTLPGVGVSSTGSGFAVGNSTGSTVGCFVLADDLQSTGLALRCSVEPVSKWKSVFLEYY